MITKQELAAALRKAFNMGQTYWLQADSENVKNHRKSEQTAQEFRLFVEEMCEKVDK